MSAWTNYRYSLAFKQKVIKEIEEGLLSIAVPPTIKEI